MHQNHDHFHRDHGGEKTVHSHEEPTASRFQLAGGARYTRLSLDGEGAHLWETTVGVEYTVAPWLHLGADVSYGCFDSDEGSADGLMVPHAHADIHLPLGGSWELLAGFDVGFPGGDEALVGDHWEFTPNVALRYDRHRWFTSAGASFAFVEGGDHAHGGAAGGDHPHGESSFEEVVDPHGKRELHYFTALGLRVLDGRLEFESRFSGIHVTSGDTPDCNYLRAGLRASWKVDERWAVSAQASLPLTDARRNEWQTSLAVRVGF